MSTFGFDIAVTGLNAAGKALRVTQNNIANANTEGYARQEVEFSPITTSSTNGLGTLANIYRVKNDVLIEESRYRQADFSYFETLENHLAKLEGVYGENTPTAISNLLPKFFNAWEEAVKFPEQPSYREALIGEAEQLTNQIKTIMKETSAAAVAVDKEIEVKVQKINDLTKKIAETNEIIRRGANTTPHSMYDSRDQLIDQLSQLVEVKVTQSVYNPELVDVKIDNYSVVLGENSKEIQANWDTSKQGWFLDVPSHGVVLKPSGGSIAGDIEFRNNFVLKYTGSLHNLASSLITEVNALHTTGYGLDNTTGNAFFSGTDALTIGVDAAVAQNSTKVALSNATGVPGNAQIGRAIADLRENAVMIGGKNITAIDYYNSFTVSMAVELSRFKGMAAGKEALLVSSQRLRASEQGVNMDEEMTQLLEFQRYYQANAKVLQTVNQTYDALMDLFR